MAAAAGAATGGGGSYGGDSSSKLSSNAAATTGTGAKAINIGGNPNVALGISSIAKSPLILVAIVIGVVAFVHFRRKS